MKAVSTMLGNLEFFLNVLRIPLFFFSKFTLAAVWRTVEKGFR